MPATAGDHAVHQPIRVLLAEDNLDHAVMVESVLNEEEGFELVHVRTGDAALDEAERRSFEAVVVDHRLPDWGGLKLCREIRDRAFDGALLLVSSARSDRLAREAGEAGADGFLVKSDRFGQRVADAIRDALEDGGG